MTESSLECVKFAKKDEMLLERMGVAGKNFTTAVSDKEEHNNRHGIIICFTKYGWDQRIIKNVI